MKQAVLKAWDLPGLSVTALVLFVACFSIYTWWTYRRHNKAGFEQAAMIPIEEAQIKSVTRKQYE